MKALLLASFLSAISLFAHAAPITNANGSVMTPNSDLLRSQSVATDVSMLLSSESDPNIAVTNGELWIRGERLETVSAAGVRRIVSPMIADATNGVMPKTGGRFDSEGTETTVVVGNGQDDSSITLKASDKTTELSVNSAGDIASLSVSGVNSASINVNAIGGGASIKKDGKEVATESFVTGRLDANVVRIGLGASASETNTIAIGQGARATHRSAITIGLNGKSHGESTFNVRHDIGRWYAGDTPVIQSLLMTGYTPSNVTEVVTNPPSLALRASNGPVVVTNEYVVYVPDPNAPTLLRHGEETASDLSAALTDVLTNDVVDCQFARSNLVKVVEGGLTGLVEAIASPKYRPFGDEFVYEPGEMSGFQWSCQSKPGLSAALGTIQPQFWYDYGGDYRQWELEFTYGGMDWHVTAYNTYNSPLVTFSGWGWAYDYDADEYHEDYVDDLEGRRTAGEYHRRDPVETFAHNSQVQPIYTEMTQIRNLVSGDDLKQRSGGLGEYGYGPGYVSRDIRSERRNWRIRVPKWISIQNMTTNNIQASSVFYLTESNGSKSVTFRIPESSYNQYANAVLSNPLSWLLNWDMRHRLVETRGAYGSDCCRMADYKIGLFLLAPGLSDKCAVKFKVVQTAYSPMSFSVTPDYTGLSAVNIYNPDSTTSRCLCSEALVDAPPFTTRWAQTVSGVQITNETTCTITGIAVRGTEASPSVVQSTNGQIALNLYHISDRTFKVYRADTGSVLTNFTQTGVIGKFTVTINCNSNTQFMDYTAPFYKVLTSQDGNFYYDVAGDSSYRVDVSNGCFYAEKFMDGDWRKAADNDL